MLFLKRSFLKKTRPRAEKKNIGLYEVIADFPVKLYFDIDETEDKKGLHYFEDIIYKYISDAKLSISGSETDGKNSNHIIINN
jgi:hypothetical protein